MDTHNRNKVATQYNDAFHSALRSLVRCVHLKGAQLVFIAYVRHLLIGNASQYPGGYSW